jgi:tryptophan synthase alpha chain
MDGPVIAGAHAVVTEERGILAETAMALIGGLRHIPQPRFVMTYTEVGRALPGFLRLCVENDIHGVIAPDISYDEGRYVATIARALNLAVLMLLDARADAETVRQRVELGDMIYLKVSAGRTGDRVEIDSRHDALANAIEQIRALDAEIPIGVGIGLQHPDQIAAMAALGVDMAIVGTKVVEKSQIGNGALVDYLESLRAATYYREAKS